MNINDVKIGISFVEIIGNVFITDISDKNYDLKKLLKGIVNL